ncbi:hypothetical protein ASE16_01695 [Leifsonia sp. Root227]|jgi:uncharacterized protein YuzE|uniref:DUF2283 domain-containing protein n=1 Tax=unclassified Leifsonia TaxID=2663824 RepID=UPI0006F325C6|nr:DUF2283 domain-containing protein [Leifsonia sp. Root227]KRC51814.1 hypothetical protein ASE16_01695 [Leifsonia sp. Root227]
MRLTYDPELDVAHFRLDVPTDPSLPDRSAVPDAPAAGAHIDAEFDAAGFLVGFEVLGAHLVLRPDVLAAAERASRA